MPNLITAQIISIGPFKGFFFKSVPPRIEAQVLFDSDCVGHKLTHHMMDISWKHGFGCSAPRFHDEDQKVLFSIGTVMPSERSLSRCSKRLQVCLYDIARLSTDFVRQMDFSRLDLSMFSDVDIQEFDPQLMAALRDQQYGGDWQRFKQAMEDSGREDEAKMVERCREFEVANSKDMGLVGNKLMHALATLDDGAGKGLN